MKARKPKTTRNPQSPRTFSLHARFTPEGPDAGDRKIFFEFWVAAQERILKLRHQEKIQDQARFARLQAAERKARPVFERLLRHQLSPAAAEVELKPLIPDPQLRAELWARHAEEARTTPEQIVQEEQALALRHADLARQVRLVKVRTAIAEGLGVLLDAARAGDRQAAEELVDAAQEAADFVACAQKAQPETLRRVAGRRMHWPVLVSDEPGWEVEAVRQVDALQLGSALGFLKVRFRQARGTDRNLPARLWAKAAVRTLEETRWRWSCFGNLAQAFQTIEALKDFCRKAGWGGVEAPVWTDQVLRLAPFSTASLPQWKQLIRVLIREQMPAFHTRPEWANQRHTAAASGRDTPGEIQNAILDDIGSALERLAPAPTCGNSPAELQQMK